MRQNKFFQKQFHQELQLFVSPESPSIIRRDRSFIMGWEGSTKLGKGQGSQVLPLQKGVCVKVLALLKGFGWGEVQRF